MAPSLGLPIDNFERTLLRDFLVTFGDGTQKMRIGSENIKREVIHRAVFLRWSWTSRVYGQMHQTCSSDELYHFHEGDRARLWTLFLNRLQWGHAHSDSNFSKVLGLQTSNPGYPQAFVDQKEGLPFLLPVGKDKEFWELISQMFLAIQYNVSIFSAAGPLAEGYEKHLQQLTGLEDPMQRGANNVGDHDQSKERSRLPLTVRQSEASGESQTVASGVPNPTSEVDGTGRLNEKGLTEDDEDSTGANDAKSSQQRKKADDFEIWSLIRLCAMIERGGRRSDKIWPALLQCGFEELYDAVGNGFLRKDFNETYMSDGRVS